MQKFYDPPQMLTGKYLEP